MEIKANEISAVLKHQIEKFRSESAFEETGEIIQLGDGIARVYGLENVMSSELLQFSDDNFGMALNLEEDNIGCILFGDERALKQGDIVKRTGKVMQVPVGKSLIGRVITPLGQAIDSDDPLRAESFLPLERKALGVVERLPVKEPLQTGIKSIDSMIPIGRGQRELIIGDRQIGKSTLAIDTIINQRNEDVYCIYVAIGQKASTIAKVFQTLKENHAMEYTTIVAATANDPAPMNFIAPYAGASMGEYFRDNGMHSLVVFDDLSKHAWAYRQVSLLLRRPPGREAYPGDIFYLHSRLLERAAKLNDDLGGGSMTALPIVETQGGDFSAYIPTNIISITDGQIYLEPDLFYANIRPAINIGLSVSRVGGNAQIPAMKSVAGKLRLELAQYRELESFAKLSSELDKSTREQLNRGQKLIELLKQSQHQTLPIEKQIAILYLGTQGFLDDVDVNDIMKVEAHFLEYLTVKYDQLLVHIRQEHELSDALRQELEDVCRDFIARYRRS